MTNYKVKQLEFDFQDWVQIVPYNDGNHMCRKIIVPSNLYINRGMEMPYKDPDIEISPCNGIIPSIIQPFHETRAEYNKGIINDVCPYFYLPDDLFQCVLNNPLKYVVMLSNYNSVIGMDNSLYMNFSYEIIKQNVWRNKAMTKFWQINGINVICNVSWAGPNSYDYCFKGLPKHSIIAINCMGVKGDRDACYFWHKGYEEAIKRLEPSSIIRYGDKMTGEYEQISKYFPNPYINRLRGRRAV